MGTLEGRVAVVTGAGRGIGYEYARALAEDGATVVVADVDAAMARTASSELAASGKVVDAQVDVSDQASTRRLAAEVAERFGAAHIVVNNAAIYHSMRRDSVLEVDIEYWRHVMAVNVDGALLMTQAFAPLMIEAGWGRVVNQASTAAYSGGVGGHYAVSKLAVIGVTQALAQRAGTTRGDRQRHRSGTDLHRSDDGDGAPGRPGHARRPAGHQAQRRAG